MISADLGGRVGWLPKAERVKTLLLSPYSPKTRGGWGLRQAPTRRFAKNRNLRGLGGFCGFSPGPWWAGPQALGARAPKAPGDLAHRPLGPGSRQVFMGRPNTLETWPTSPSPASRQPSRVKNSKNAPVLIGS